MKRIPFVILFCLFVAKITAQNKINGYQYWFDNQLVNAVSTSITPVQNFTLSEQINTNSLLQGLHLFNIKFKDDSLRESVVLSSFFYKSSPANTTANINTYQYWFDNNSSSAVTQSVTASPTYTLSNDLNTPGLLNGLHLLHVRFKDNDNLWSETMSHVFFKSALPGSTNTITAYQYWFDNNSSSSVTQSVTASPTYTLSNDLNTSGLLSGLHLLHVRFKDNNNLWSETMSHVFFKSALQGGINTIVAFQYWFDQNVNATVQQSITPGVSYTLSAPIDAIQLQDGLHILQVRFLDNDHKWSVAASQFFYKSSFQSNTNIVKLQYWFDQNFTGAIQQTITPSATYNFSELLNANTLLNGLHTISVRFADVRNKWSSTISQFFYKEKPDTVSENKTTAYRYWFDEGDSSLNLVNIAPFMNPFIINQQIAADGMDSGFHQIHFQFRDLKGQWSMVTSDSISVTTKAIYTFNGNGNWSDPSNWVNKQKPPLNLTGTYRIFIDPIVGGHCILDAEQHISTGTVITVKAGKSFIIPGNIQMNE